MLNAERSIITKTSSNLRKKIRTLAMNSTAMDNSGQHRLIRVDSTLRRALYERISSRTSSSSSSSSSRYSSSSRMSVRTTTRARVAGILDAAQITTKAAEAILDVSKTVRMKGIEAPNNEKSYVALDVENQGLVDDDGLPLVYDPAKIQIYWKKQGGALQKRWLEFLRESVPFLTRVASLSISGGNAELTKNGASLAKDAREIIQRLGPTYIKAGQMMSVRPDVLPKVALDELAILQDSVKAFSTTDAITIIENELGGPLSEFFDEISERPVAAASLAQVYRAKLKGKDEFVAVKVQRPGILATVSKDLYVLRRAAEVYQGIIERFAPQQRTDYVALLNEWAIGFYTELDFINEAKNQDTLRRMLMDEEKVADVYVPAVNFELTTRRVLVSEWIDGVKLSECEPSEIRELVGIGQECFLVQLLQVGFFHSDPHPGNLMKMNDQSKGKLCILDFGLVARINEEDQDAMVNSIVHLANKDYAALVDDFIDLKILPDDCDRAKVVPLMDKALSPYVKGGGAKRYEAELKRMYNMDGSLTSTAGGFQAMTQDLLTVLNDIPFSIPPYFALLGRAVVTLEGIALLGNPDYKLIMEAYPFVARKLLSDDRPAAQRALQEVLYASTASGGSILKGERLAVMLNSAMGIVAETSDTFVDLETLPEDAASLKQSLKYVLTPRAESLRKLLVKESIGAADVLARQALRKTVTRAFALIPRPPSWLPFQPPNPEDIEGPLFLPTRSGTPTPVFASPARVLELTAPKLSREEELFAISLGDLVTGVAGKNAATILTGDALMEPDAIAGLLLGILASGRSPLGNDERLLSLARSTRKQLESAEVTIYDDARNSNSDGGFDELLDAVNDLTAEESAVLRACGQEVVDALWSSLLDRLSPLLGSNNNDNNSNSNKVSLANSR